MATTWDGQQSYAIICLPYTLFSVTIYAAYAFLKWFGHVFFAGQFFVYPQSPYHDSDMIFWLLRIVRGYAFVTSTDPQKFGFESHLRSYCHVHLADDRSTGSRLLYFLLLLQRADETQQGGNSCPRWLLLAFSLNSIMLPR